MKHELERTHFEAYLGSTIDLSLALGEAELIREYDRAQVAYHLRDLYLERIAEVGSLVLDDVLKISEEFLEGEAIGHRPLRGQMVFDERE